VPKGTGNYTQNEDSDVKYWLVLKFLPRLSVRKKLALVDKFGLRQLFHAPPTQHDSGLSLAQHNYLLSPDWNRAEMVLTQTKACGGEVIGYSCRHYPRLLKEIFDPPLILFAKGRLELLNQPQLAVIGSRNVSYYGKDTAFRFAKELARISLVITSGLAIGVDASAHQGALAETGATIAVIATGIDVVYPARHKPLAAKILDKGGLIVSEFMPETPARAGHFPKRNRLISGMSQGVLVVEAAMKSGSLITAKCALEHNRDVYAVPGVIQNPNAQGCHWLIKQGAKLVDDPADIEEELAVNTIDGLHLNKDQQKQEDHKKSNNKGLCNDPLLASVGYEITPVDKVVSRSKLPIDVVLTRLTMLELRGLVSAVPGGYLKLNRG